MFEHFTDHARSALELEGTEARRMHHAYLGTEHLLLGLIREPEGHGHRALEAVGLDLKHVRQAVADLTEQGPHEDLRDSMPRTEHFKHVMRVAIDEARQLRHGDVGPEHLLLALLKETDGVAFKVLDKLGVAPTAVRRKVLEMLEEERASKA